MGRSMNEGIFFLHGYIRIICRKLYFCSIFILNIVGIKNLYSALSYLMHEWRMQLRWIYLQLVNTHVYIQKKFINMDFIEVLRRLIVYLLVSSTVTPQEDCHFICLFDHNSHHNMYFIYYKCWYRSMGVVRQKIKKNFFQVQNELKFAFCWLKILKS